MSGSIFIGVDLAWTEGNETGVVGLEESGRVSAAGWTRGVAATAEWICAAAGARGDALVFVDAPLVVENEGGMRLCERQVGQRYGRSLVSANASNLGMEGRLGGMALLEELRSRGFAYSDGADGPPSGGGRFVSECYPFTTIVGSDVLGYEVRPAYKRKPRRVTAAEFRPLRAAACDELIRRVGLLAEADPPLDLRSHEATRALLHEPSPCLDRAYKRREDLLDAALAAWTAALWRRHGFAACQVLGEPPATIVAPAKAGQR